MTSTAPPPATLDLAEGPGGPEGRRRRIAPWVAAGAAVAVTALVAGGLAVGGRGPLAGALGSEPKVLNIGTWTSAGGTTDAVSDPKGLRAGRYVLTGSLPDSPTRGSVLLLSGDSLDEARVAALAASFGLSEPPSREGDDWVVREGAAALRVYGQPGLPFAFDASPDDDSCPSIPTAGFLGPDSTAGCVTSAPAPATAPVPGPDDAALHDLARAVTGALGADADVTVWRGAPYGSVVLDPTLDGVHTANAAIMIQASTDGVLAASGWLGGFVPSGFSTGDTYPLRTARDAFAALASMPEPEIACAESVDGTPACGGDVTLTGATYGLSLAFDDGRPVLVPTWLFAVEGSETPLTMVAVERRYLGDSTGPGSGTGGGTSASTDGNPGVGTNPATEADAPPAAASDLPLDVDPAVDPIKDPESGAATPRGPLVPGATVRVVGPRSLLLDAVGGCELQTAVAAAEETATTVVVTYTFQPLPCPSALSGPTTHAELPVTLRSDLAGRTVVDEAGTPIPVTDAR